MSATETLTPDALLARIRQDGIRRTALALRKPPIPSTFLQSFADLSPEEAPEAREFVAAYPLSPSHLLEALAAQNPSSAVLAQLASNPRTPPQLLIELAAHPEAAVRTQAAQHPQLPARELLALTDDTDTSVRRALATNPSLRLPQQAILVVEKDPAVRVALAGQTALATPAALALAIDDSALVRLHTVATAPADDDTLAGWAATDEEDVQLALLRRRTLTKEAERLLFHSSHAAVRRAVREQVKPDEIDLLNLITCGEAEERRWVAARPKLPRALQRVVAQDADASVRAALAANPALDPCITAYFVDLADEPACVALAGNTALTQEQLQLLTATRYPAVLTALAYREKLEPALVSLLVSCSPEFRRHWAIQERPLANLDAETARALLADPLPAVRALAVRGHNWRRADLYDLVRDPVARVRIAVVQHPNAPDELIEDASTDSEAEVVTAAREVQRARLARPKPANLPPVRVSTAAVSTVQAPASPASPVSAASLQPAVATPANNLLSKLTRLFR